jgi:hypothetical protein
MTCACSTRTAAFWQLAGSRMAWLGWASCMSWWPPCRGPRAGGGRRPDRPGSAGRGAAGRRLSGVCGQPHAVSRYRGRHGSSRAKSDRGDAKVLADLVRTDRHNHRPVAGDSPLAEAVKVLARAYQGLIWARQRHVNALRSALREFYPGAVAALGAQLAEPEALAVLALAPTPEQGRRRRSWPRPSRSRPPTVRW